MKVDIAKLNDVLQISAAVFGALAALAALGAYFTSGRVQEALEEKVTFLENEQAGRVLTQDQTAGLVSALAAGPKPTKPIYLIGIQ